MPLDPAAQNMSDQHTEALLHENAIPWTLVETTTRAAFNIWVGQPEIEWAKAAFHNLARAGLLDDSSPLTRQLAVLRVLATAGIYHDSCEAAWEETSDIDYTEWCEDSLLDKFLLGFLFGTTQQYSPEEELDFGEAVNALVEEERPAVVEALIKGFGSVAELYASLWKSCKFSTAEPNEPEGDSEVEEYIEDDYEVFEPDEVGKLAAYERVAEGCCRRAE